MGTGKDFVRLEQKVLNVGEIVNLIVSPKCGAISTFVGTTRDNFENKKVIKLEYEAYEPMALKEMNNICAKIRSQWNIEHIAIYHRLGEVPVTEASVVIAVSSPHRQESLRAVEYAINTLKASVPIWKKEIYDIEEPKWKENKECIWSNNTVVCNETIEKWKDSSKSSCSNEKGSLEDVEMPVEEPVLFDPNLVQIRASSDELKHRIESFIQRKRQQVNLVNVQEFCCYREQCNEKQNSCARVDAILIRRKDSKSHVKVHRVLNAWGPQTVDQSSLHKATNHTTNQSNNNYSSVLDDRISTAEKMLGIIKPVSRDIYERLKNIENRILFLEGVSPEYKDFWVTEDIDNLTQNMKPVRKRTYSMAELDSKLHELENKYAKTIK
ncbi:molybdopterin synthase catalytic subunit isoform X1 [Vespa crabro]|uniref:molybdopterin synthase catalytic subunit isoform X1 n=2 Tax=Vespa TaxID=7443 RepID=UPI001F00E9F6|nr:molybdopterin synthase catalytic subunit isoform X1 [Vespa crabro]XP_046819376.1 molybdopterin synthase catalytic subunit isoform X1 [Vespa crabro]XP_046819377.1 molybdopterin synthase catalytic subunit isoform X1 [Vespa crabro]